jgi:hypothetical protein
LLLSACIDSIVKSPIVVIEHKACPLNPKLWILLIYSNYWSLDVAPWSAILFKLSKVIPHPLSVTSIFFLPKSSKTILIIVAFASIELSISYLIIEGISGITWAAHNLLEATYDIRTILSRSFIIKILINISYSKYMKS